MLIDELISQCIDWKTSIDKIKQEAPPGNFTWYGHDILSNLWHIEKLLSERNRDLFSWVSEMPIADIGAADGDLSFFLQSRGFDVDIIDWPNTNWNGLQGARAIKDILDSPVGIHEVDLDSQFNMPRNRYGLVLFLGILYHLKNPFYALEKLARTSRFCFISTRIARYTEQNGTPFHDLPMAYLLTPDECNDDPTNYWIFSQAGLERLVDRTGWEILDAMTVGDTEASDPRSPEHDERAFMLLESRHPG